jgi:copper chaperone CopZ
MKRTIFMLALVVCSLSSVLAKDIKTVVLTTTPQMQCQNCENKIKNNIRFEKGVKEIQTDLETKNVTVTYDAEKTNVENLIAGFKKIGYTATEVKGGCCKSEAKSGCCKSEAKAKTGCQGACCQGKKAEQSQKKEDCCK